MTPQVQQVFAVPIAGAIASPAVLADGGVDVGGGQGVAAVGADCGFAKLMQTADAALDAKAIAPQTAPLLPDSGAPAVVAMILRSTRHDLAQTTLVAPEEALTVPKDTAALPVEERDIRLADPAYVPAQLVLMPVPMLATNIPLPVILPAPQPIVPQGTDAADIAASLPPLSPFSGMSLPPKGEKAAPSPPIAAAVPAATIVTQDADRSVAQAPPATPTPIPAAAPAQTATPAAIVGAAPATLSPATLSPLATPSPPVAKPAMAAAGPVQQRADIALVRPPEPPPKPARATPAETAFRLRTGGADIAVAPETRHGAATMPQRTSAQFLPAPGVFTPPITATDPAADAPIAPDQTALSPLGLAPDLPAPPATHGPDIAKPTPTTPPQIAAPPAATPTVATPLPPRLTADLVTLAKTQPNGPIQILLNPAELGNLRFEIHQNADQLRVVLAVERPETMDLLRRNADQLLGEFRAAGFSGASLSFGQWDQQNNQPRHSPAPQLPPQDRAFIPPQPPAKPAHTLLEMAASSGLNLRL